MPDLLFGCLLAVYWDKNRVFFDGIKQVQKGTIRLVYALGILMILFKNVIFTENLVVFERYAIACFFCFVIVDQIQNERKISCAWLHKRLLFLGKISYGIYMYHLVVMYLLYDYVLSGLDYKGLNHFQLMLYAALYVVLAPSLTIIVSHVSFTLFEKPFLRLKSRF
jgi:peptidoglycan/LPS O-acetylase OafA/YrhL